MLRSGKLIQKLTSQPSPKCTIFHLNCKQIFHLRVDSGISIDALEKKLNKTFFFFLQNINYKKICKNVIFDLIIHLIQPLNIN